MTKIQNQILPQEKVDELKKPLPPQAIKPHPTKTFLSTINPIYVVERLNEVFGIGSWYFDTEVIIKENKMIVVKGELTVPEYQIRISAYGGNDNPDLGDAYKGAQTDSLTKAASYLGIGVDVWKDTKKQPEKQPNQINSSEEAKNWANTPQGDKPWLNIYSDKQKTTFTKEWENAVRKLEEGTITVKKIQEHYKLNKEVFAQLTEIENFNQSVNS